MVWNWGEQGSYRVQALEDYLTWAQRFYDAQGCFSQQQLVERNDENLALLQSESNNLLLVVSAPYGDRLHLDRWGVLEELPEENYQVFAPKDFFGPVVMVGVSSCDDVQQQNGCQGETLFEDEFDGEELDEGKWETYLDGRENEFYRFSEGILEMNVPKGGGSLILDSRSTYEIGDSTLCFEARWRVREREGTDYSVGMRSDDYKKGVSFELGFGHDYLDCGTAVAGNLDTAPCDTDVTKWHTTKFEINKKRTQFYIDNKLMTTSEALPLNDTLLLIDMVCSSSDKQEKKCYVDFLRLLEKD